jgi:hypothetical protein
VRGTTGDGRRETAAANSATRQHRVPEPEPVALAVAEFMDEPLQRQRQRQQTATATASANRFGTRYGRGIRKGSPVTNSTTLGGVGFQPAQRSSDSGQDAHCTMARNGGVGFQPARRPLASGAAAPRRAECPAHGLQRQEQRQHSAPGPLRSPWPWPSPSPDTETASGTGQGHQSPHEC